MRLPEAFIEDLKPYMSAAELDTFCLALTETEASTCIRANSMKLNIQELTFDEGTDCQAIPWNPELGRYLSERPSFTLDPRLHAGAYYVQEASSQFIAHILRSLLQPEQPVTMLDLCAAPGGKSTAALTSLPKGSILVSNEIDHRRARILSENVTKWGMSNVIVTGNAPRDFTQMTHIFDVILTDVPCSGEGMFRKDEGAVKDWSPAKVEGCVKLQREILQDIWPALKPGGCLIYGTCTFNVHEDEEQLRFICDELGAEPIMIPVEDSWNIHQPLTDQIPCYRFMPHYTKGEGLFMAALRKIDDGLDHSATIMSMKSNKKAKNETIKTPKKHQEREKDRKCGKGGAPVDTIRIVNEVKQWVNVEGTVEVSSEGSIRLIPDQLQNMQSIVSAQGLYMLQSGIELGTIKGKDIIPAHALALNIDRNPDAFPCVNLDKESALNYLRREAITLPEDSPIGYVVVCFENLPLGFVKNIGNRCNNLYPQEWRIRFS